MPNNRQTTLRIIGGKWRGRKLKVCQDTYLRPTTNFVRETLFNWLNPVTHDAVCLDMFAGSGALGFEALSRGAKHVTMMDQSKAVIKTLRDNAKMLEVKNLDLICKSFSPKLNNPFAHIFDVVFLDPPFYKNLIAPCCEWLEKNNCLNKNAYIYIEAEKELETIKVPEKWGLLRQKSSGAVRCYLYCIDH